MKNVKKTVLILICLFILGGISLTGFCLVTLSSETKKQPNQLVLKIPDKDILLTADLDNVLHIYKNFKVKIGTQEKTFDWKSIGNTSFPPSVKLINLGNNNNGGLVVTLVASEGTGNYVQILHVFRIDSFKEIPVEDPLKLIKMHTKVENIGGNVVIDIDNTKVTLTKEYLQNYGVNRPVENLIYDNHIIYGVKNNNLVVEIGVSNENLNYFGNIYIEYIYVDEMLKMKNIRFQTF